MEALDVEAHHLVLDPQPEQTLGRCTCGQWSRGADTEVVAITGRSREETLRAAHERHARGLDGAAGPAMA